MTSEEIYVLRLLRVEADKCRMNLLELVNHLLWWATGSSEDNTLSDWSIGEDGKVLKGQERGGQGEKDS